jgi:hypothetical protein
MLNPMQGAIKSLLSLATACQPGFGRDRTATRLSTATSCQECVYSRCCGGVYSHLMSDGPVTVTDKTLEKASQSSGPAHGKGEWQ